MKTKLQANGGMESDRLTDGETDGWEEGQTERPEFIRPSGNCGGPINDT